MHTAIPLPHPCCPLCGKPNDCAPARSGSFNSRCWCNQVMIPQEVLDRIPHSRHDACICKACATSSYGARSTAPRSADN